MPEEENTKNVGNTLFEDLLLVGFLEPITWNQGHVS